MSDIHKISSRVLYVLLALSTILAILFYFGGSTPDSVGSSFDEKKFTSINLIWGIILFVITLLLTIGFGIANLIKNPLVIKRFLMIAGIAGIVILVCFLMSASHPLSNLKTTHLPSAISIKMVGTGLLLTYILLGIAFMGIIITEIMSAFNK